eukprot:snap_masked-scaffold_1-processed-gene-24.59-mRNA-1 protein AED:0.33 eAED:0.33 QI:0/-1/0/1/-1/1/1/0/1058
MELGRFPRDQYTWKNVSSFERLIEVLRSGAEGIDFTDGFLTEEEMKQMVKLLMDDQNCLALNFSSCGLQIKQFRIFSPVLSTGTLLKYLYLYDNMLGDEGAQCVAENMYENSTITFLSLSKNKIGNRGAKALASLLSSNSTLKFLGIASNNIADEGMCEIADSLKKNQSLSELVVSYNPYGEDSELAFADALYVNMTVSFLGLNQDKVSPAGSKALAEVLKYNTKMEYYGLGVYTAKSKKIKRKTAKMLARNKKEARKSFERYKRNFENTLLSPKDDPVVEWNKCKLMVLGSSRVGKTQTVRTLQGFQFRETEESTIGIDISFAKTQKKTRTKSWVRLSSVKARQSFTLELAARNSIILGEKEEKLDLATIKRNRKQTFSEKRQNIRRSINRTKRRSRIRSRGRILSVDRRRSSAKLHGIDETVFGVIDSSKTGRRSRKRSLRESIRRRRSSIRSGRSRLSSRVSFTSNMSNALGRMELDSIVAEGRRRSVADSVGSLTHNQNFEAGLEETEPVLPGTEKKSPQPISDSATVRKYAIPDNFILAQDAQNEKTVSFNIFDFGGQAVFYPLHHLFLSNFGIYVVVFNIQRVLETISNDSGALDVVNFWLQSVSLQAPDAPVILVGTHLDQVDARIHLPLVNQMLSKLALKNKVSPNEPLGYLFHPLSNKDNSGAKRLRAALETIAHDLSPTREEVSLRWVKCFENLFSYAAENQVNDTRRDSIKSVNKDRMNVVSSPRENMTTPYLEIEEVAAQANKLGINSADELSDMLGFFHDHGFLIHLTSTVHLEKIVVLDPQWLLDAITELIRDTQLHHHKEEPLIEAGLLEEYNSFKATGVATRDILEFFWSEDHFHFVLDLLHNIMLLSEWNFGADAMYIFPAMICAPPPPELSTQLTHVCEINFQNYSVPDGVFHRLVCLSVEYSRESQLEWNQSKALEEPSLYTGVSLIPLGHDENFLLRETGSIIRAETNDTVVAYFLAERITQMIQKIDSEMFHKRLEYSVSVSTPNTSPKQFLSFAAAQESSLEPWFGADRQQTLTSSQLNRTRRARTSFDLFGFLES